MFGNTNHEAIKKLRQEIEALDRRIGDQSSTIRKLEFQVNNPAKYKKGDKPLKGIAVTDVELKWISMCHYGYWDWRYKAIDLSTLDTFYLEFDCGGNIITC